MQRSNEDEVALAVDDDELVRGGRKRVETVLGDHAVILEAHAAHTGQVHARLDGDDRTSLDHVARTTKDGLLVDVDAHAVAQAVAIVLAIARVTDDLLGQKVDCLLYTSPSPRD